MDDEGKKVKVKLTPKGQQTLMLWVNHVPPSQAPKELQHALTWLYRDFASVKISIGLMFQIDTAQCETPNALRRRAEEAIDKINEIGATYGATPAAVEAYKNWAMALNEIR